jgi:hypothetical protein
LFFLFFLFNFFCTTSASRHEPLTPPPLVSCLSTDFCLPPDLICAVHSLF